METTLEEMNPLVNRLTVPHQVACATPEHTVEALKECLDRNYVQVLFVETQTELGVQLYRPECNFEEADLTGGRGKLRLVGGLMLNYEQVKCVVDIDLPACEGTGYLVPVSPAEYEVIMGRVSANQPLPA